MGKGKRTSEPRNSPAIFSEIEGDLLELSTQISAKTGLSVEACAELFEKGWTYTEELHQPPRWQHPSAQMKIRQVI